MSPAALARLLLWLAAAASLPSPVAADHGAGDERIALPDGPGSIGGIGQNLHASGNMGAMVYEVELELPKGFAGATPRMVLQYNSFAGNGPLGIGWALPVPHIERFTRRGLPRYGRQDIFESEAGEELVPVQGDRFTSARMYRARFEGGFARYLWHGDPSGRGGYWEVEYPNGVRAFFGADAKGRPVAAARVSADDGDENVFRYMLVETQDRVGHRVRYHYGVDGRYPLLERVTYLYRGAPDSSRGPRFDVRLAYEARGDTLSSGLPGFDLRLSKRLSSVSIGSLGNPLRTYRMEYEQTSAATSRLIAVHLYGADGTPFPATRRFEYSSSQQPYVFDMGRLTSSGGAGLDLRNGRSTLIDINGDALPDLVDTGWDGSHAFYLNQRQPDGGYHFGAPRPSLHTQGGSSFVLDQPGVQVLDLNGDGFADMLDAAGGRVLCNRGAGDWSGESFCFDARRARLDGQWNDDPDATGEADPRGMRFFDYDGDKRIDLLHTMTPDATRVWHNKPEAPDFQRVQATGRVFDRDELQLADLNGDGLLDLIDVGYYGDVWFRLHLGFGRWTPAVSFPVEGRRQGETFERPELQDLNGDGLDDIVVVNGSSVRFALNLGGRFAPLQRLNSADVRGALPIADGDTSVLFADMNASGTTDVVWVRASDGLVQVLELFPLRPNLLTRIDNGLGGIQTVAYTSSATERSRDERAGRPWRHKLPQALNVVTVTERYASASEELTERLERSYHHGFYEGIEKRFQGFGAVTEVEPADRYQEATIRELSYDVGAEDVYRQGLLLSESVFGQAEGSPPYPLSRVTRTHEDCAVAGARPMPGAPEVRHLCETSIDTLLQEGAAPDQWLWLRTQRQYDGFGQAQLEAQLGVVGRGPEGTAGCEPCDTPEGTFSGACGARCLGDELYTHTDYVDPGPHTAGRWLLGRPWRTQTYAQPGGTPRETLFYYDGPAFVGLPLGSLARGNQARTCQRSAPGSASECAEPGWVQTVRNEHDAHGNVVTSLDALGGASDESGHRQSVRYDAYGKKPVQTRFWLSVDATPYQLVRTATYDPLFYEPTTVSRWTLVGAPVRSTQAPTHITYDPFGRRSKIVSPGDSLLAPSVEYEYKLAAPISTLVVRRRSKAGGSPDLEERTCIDGLGRTLQNRTRLDEHRYQVTGFHQVNPRGKPVRVYQGYVGTRQCDRSAPPQLRFKDYFYDALGRTLVVREPDAEMYGKASETLTHYAPLTRSVWDPVDNDEDSAAHGTPQRSDSDGLGRLVRLERVLERGAAPDRVRALWDEQGNFAGHVDPQGHTKRQVFDLLGRLTRVHDPNAGTTFFEYDAANNLVTRTDARGQSVHTEYDGANRPIARYDAANRQATLSQFRYDFAPDCAECTHGEWKQVQSSYPLGAERSRGRDTWGFDTRGRRVVKTRTLDGRRFHTETQFDHANRTTARRFPDGTTFAYDYDGASRLLAIDGVLDRVSYDERGLPREVRYANGTRQHSNYDGLQRLHSLELFGPEDHLLKAQAYERDRAGNLDSMRAWAGSMDKPLPSTWQGEVVFEHDSFYRVTRAHYPTQSLAASFDSLDNLQRKTSDRGRSASAHAGRYGYDAGQPNAALLFGDLPLSYDAAGLMQHRAGCTLRWNHQQRLASARNAQGQLAEYWDDASGTQRVLEQHGASTTYFVSPSFEVRDGISVAYARFGALRIARLSSQHLGPEVLPDHTHDGAIGVADAVLAEASASEREALLWGAARRVLREASEARVWLHADALGSLEAATDRSGRVLGRRAFDVTGNVRAESGFVDHYGFTGQRRDPTTHLLHFRFRELDTVLGRWTSPDPMFRVSSAQNLVRWGESTTSYAYVAGRWDISHDPLGLFGLFRQLMRVTALTHASGPSVGTFRKVHAPTEAQGSLWVSDAPNTSGDLATLVGHLRRTERVHHVKVLTGTHGTPDGHTQQGDGFNFLGSDRLAIDRELTPMERSDIHVDLVDVGGPPGYTGAQLRQAVSSIRPREHVVLAWCYSDRDQQLVDMYQSSAALPTGHDLN